MKLQRTKPLSKLNRALFWTHVVMIWEQILPALTPFLLLAAFAFARSSPRLEAWLLGHRHLGPPILAWREQRAIGRKAKRLALATMAATPVLTWAVGVDPMIVALQVAVLAAVALFVATRPLPQTERL